ASEMNQEQPSILTTASQPPDAGLAERRRSKLIRIWTVLKRAPFSAWFGMIVVLSYVLVALFAPLLAPHGEAEIFPLQFAPWSGEFPLGTDQLGRDILSRLIYGARNTIGIAFLTTCISLSIGVPLGLFAALARGWMDDALSRLVELVISIPGLVFS